MFFLKKNFGNLTCLKFNSKFPISLPNQTAKKEKRNKFPSICIPKNWVGLLTVMFHESLVLWALIAYRGL